MKLRHLILSAMAVSISFLSASVTFASDFPQTFKHRYGTTIVEKKPLRVLSLDFNGIDNLLALGMKPIAVRRNYGASESIVRPWAEAAMADHKLEVLKFNFDIDKITALQPDLILAMYSGITKVWYDRLAEIAPTIGVESELDDYTTSWRVLATTAGRAVGEAEKADEMIAAIDQKLVDAATAHPKWQSQTLAFAFYDRGQYGIFLSKSPYAKLIEKMGFITPQAFYETDSLHGTHGGTDVEFYAEDIALVDVDLLIWMVDDFKKKDFDELTLRKSLRAYKQGREILMTGALGDSFVYKSLLSIPYAIDTIVPLIELAVDGDPTTIVSTTQAAGLLD